MDAVKLALRTLAVNKPTRLAPCPADSLHRSAVDETHAVVAPTLLANRATPLEAARPALLPSNVTLAAPVAGPFDETRLETATPTAENANVTLPTCWPTVATVARPEPVTRADLQDTALEDVHIVAAKALEPRRPPKVIAELPRFDPSSVTLTAPVPAPFTASMLLCIGPTAVNAEVTVPACKPTVDATARAVPATSNDLHRTALEDVHTVVSPAVP
jgi:hypothetical protein